MRYRWEDSEVPRMPSRLIHPALELTLSRSSLLCLLPPINTLHYAAIGNLFHNVHGEHRTRD